MCPRPQFTSSKHRSTALKPAADDDRYQTYLFEAQVTHNIVTDIHSGGERPINRVVERYNVSRNTLIRRLATYAHIAAQVGSLPFNPNANNHSVLQDVIGRKYTFDQISQHYGIDRNEIIMCIADVAKEAVDAVHAKGCKDEQLWRVMAYHDRRGMGWDLGVSIAKVKGEDAEMGREVVELMERGKDEEWVLVEGEEGDRLDVL